MNEINGSNNQQQETTQENQKTFENTKPSNGSKKMAITSIILGIASIIVLIVIADIFSEYDSIGYCIIIFICSVLGMIFGILSLVKKRPGVGIAIAGIITSAMTLPIGTLFTYVLTVSNIVY